MLTDPTNAKPISTVTSAGTLASSPLAANPLPAEAMRENIRVTLGFALPAHEEVNAKRN
jgi:hypothetical protein